MATMKQDFDTFKRKVDQKIDKVHGAMTQGFEDMKSLMDKLLGTCTVARNVRALMEVDEDDP